METDTTTQASPTSARPRHKARWLYWVLAGLLVAALAGGGWWLWRYRGTSALPTAVTQAVDFPLYFPAKLPAGFHLVADSAKASRGIASYTLENASGKKVVVTVQANPRDGSQESLSGSQEFRTLEGKAYIVDFDDRTTGSLVTNQSWVIMNAPDPIGADVMHQLLSELAPVR